MHVPPPGALGPNQSIVVAWGVGAKQLGIYFKLPEIQNLMAKRTQVFLRKEHILTEKQVNMKLHVKMAAHSN